MSLLIKALEQAAKDRKTARVEPARDDPPTADAPEPTLEPPPPPRRAESRAQNRVSAADEAPDPTPRVSPTVGTSRPSRPESHASGDAPAPPRAPTSLSDLAQSDAQQRARAAAVVQASGRTANMIAVLRGNPVLLIGALAVLFGVAYGIYVYIQIANPGLLVRAPASKPATATPAPPPREADRPVIPTPPDVLTATATPAAPPATGTPSSAIEGPSAGAPSSLGMAPAQSVVASPSAPAAPVPPAAASPPVAPVALPPAASGSTGAGPSAPPAANPAVNARAAIPAGTVLGAAAGEQPRSAAAERALEPRPERAAPRADRENAAAPAPSAATPATPRTAEPVARSAREPITVSPTQAAPRLNPLLGQAYQSLQRGDLEDARAQYGKLSQTEPLNVDALLGLAYIAAQENRSEEAVRLYLRILQLNPRHALAQAALIGLMGRADPSASESRLKQLIAREPSAFLHFVLGNLYADQSQWAQAQQAYFQAHHLEPDNPDYAYNLAVGLDHLRQAKPALNFYRRAEQLATAHGRSNFNLAHARERIRILSSQVE